MEIDATISALTRITALEIEREICFDLIAEGVVILVFYSLFRT